MMGTPRFTPWNAPPLGSGIDPSKYVGKKPNKVILVPYEYRRQTLAREGDNLINELRFKANCHVILKWDLGKIIAFEIHGAGADVERGVSQVNQWISQAHIKSKDSSAWAKIPAYDPNDWYYDCIETMQDSRKLLFKGPMPLKGHPDAATHTTVLDWPPMFSTDNLYPRDVFGNKLEGLDKLRMQDEVWLILGQVDSKWQITIAGHGQSHVELAKKHLEAHLDQVRAEVSGMSYACNVILDQDEGDHVELQQNEGWWPNHADRVVPRLLPSPSALVDKPGTFRHRELMPVHLSLVQTAVKLALDKVRGRKGSYDFVVRLGFIALKATHVGQDKIGKTFLKRVFVTDIERKVELDIKKWSVV